MNDIQPGQYVADIPIHVSLVCMLVPGLAVVVRFWSRIVADHIGLGWDDWTCLAAQVLNIGYCVIGLIWSKHGSGMSITDISEGNLTFGLKLLFASYYVQPAALGFIKLSALFFYGRVFPKHNKGFNYALWAGHALIGVWMIFSIFATTFQCTPIQKFWKPEIKGRCMSSFTSFLIMCSVDTLQDVYILILPMPILWHLKTKVSKRIFIALAMLCGYCCALISLGRLIYVARSSKVLTADLIWAADKVLLWSFFEPTVGIISICVPSYFYLFRKAKADGIRSLFMRKHRHRILQQRLLETRSRSKLVSTSIKTASKGSQVHHSEIEVNGDSQIELQQDKSIV